MKKLNPLPRIKVWFSKKLVETILNLLIKQMELGQVIVYEDSDTEEDLLYSQIILIMFQKEVTIEIDYKNHIISEEFFGTIFYLDKNLAEINDYKIKMNLEKLRKLFNELYNKLQQYSQDRKISSSLSK